LRVRFSKSNRDAKSLKKNVVSGNWGPGRIGGRMGGRIKKNRRKNGRTN